MTDAEDLVKVRIDVAEMRGMLQQALSDHGQRIANLEQDNREIHVRLTNKKTALAEHGSRITGLERAVNALESARGGLLLKITAVVGSATGIIGLLIALSNSQQLQ